MCVYQQGYSFWASSTAVCDFAKETWLNSEGTFASQIRSVTFTLKINFNNLIVSRLCAVSSEVLSGGSFYFVVVGIWCAVNKRLFLKWGFCM